MAADYSDSIAIVFPSDWPTWDRDNPNQPEPHCTLIWLGNISEVSFTKEDVQDVLDRMQIKAPGSVKPIGYEVFGPEKDYLVMTVEADKLNPIRESIERALAKIGAGNASEYKEYKPHITVRDGVTGDIEEAKASVGEVPPLISLMSPVLWWGVER